MPSVGATADQGSAKVADILSATLREEKLEIELKPKSGEENQFRGVVDLKKVCQKIKLSGFQGDN
jgi:hypothetical protein